MISRVRIENFRSIKKIDFTPPRLCALVGANNVGKSNILKALDILLGETYPGDRAFNKDDFYNRDTNREIKISVWFDSPLPSCRCKSKESSQNEHINAKAFHLIHNQNGTFFEVEDDSNRLYWGNNEVRKLAPIVYIRADRNLEKQLSISEWTLLGKILKDADKEFRAGEIIEEEGRLTQNESDLKDAMDKVLEILKRPNKYQQLENSLLKNLKDQTKDLLEDFNIELKPYNPLHYYKTLQILGKEWGNFFEVTSMGSGIQNLILLALFRTYAELEKENAILAIEEPEIYLHPHTERQLYRIFRDLVYPKEGEGAQIFYTTHSANFVDLSNYKEIILVKKDKENGTKVFLSNLDFGDERERNELKVITEFNQERNEVFFARRVLLVEGNTEKHALPRLFELKGYPVDENGISIVKTGGKGNIPFFVKILSSMNIPWVVIYDTDSNYLLSEEQMTAINEALKNPDISESEKRKLKSRLEKHKETLRKNKLISDLEHQDRIFGLDPNFESICDLPTPSEEWKKIRNARDKFLSYNTYEEVPSQLREAVEKLLELDELLNNDVVQRSQDSYNEGSLNDISF